MTAKLQNDRPLADQLGEVHPLAIEVKQRKTGGRIADCRCRRIEVRQPWAGMVRKAAGSGKTEREQKE